MIPAEERAWAREVLLGRRWPPRSPPQRSTLARVLPSAAEALRCVEAERLEEAQRTLQQLWRGLELDEFEQDEFKTAELGAGCLEAAEILGVELPPRSLPPRYSQQAERPLKLREQRRQLAVPHVMAPLVNDAPARVFYAEQPDSSESRDEEFRLTARLVEHFLGGQAPRWALDRRADGRSKMAALFVRALLDRWPEAAAQLTPGRGEWNDPQALGFTGELNAEGLALRVDGIEDKVRRFFKKYPGGTLFVPAGQWQEARRLLDQLAKKPAHRSFRGREYERRIQPFRSVLDLIVRLGIVIPTAPETRLFTALGEASRRVPCWNGEVLDASKTLPLTLERPHSDDSSRSRNHSLSEDDLLEEVLQSWLSGSTRPAFLEGGPGSGKSIELRRLSVHLLRENLLLGPALRIEARRLVERGFSLERALHSSVSSRLDEAECRRLVELARSPTLAGSVWLILDGLDEVSRENRQQLRALAADWPGPSLIGARPLPTEATAGLHFRIAPLSHSEAQTLFKSLGKEAHWAALMELKEGTARTRPTDRRKELVADLCSTPLGVSLLALLDASELGERLDVPTVFRKSISTLIERAQDAGRISKQARRLVLGEGLGVLGAAAWARLRQGEALIRQEDLAAMKGSDPVLKAVHEVLENSDLVQRVAPERYQFSHKSLAEFCAALHLVQQPGAEAELLRLAGDPGAEAISNHLAALLPSRERLTAFIRSLGTNPHRPFSSLALATRLLVANGPERVETSAALDVLSRRVRFASHGSHLQHRYGSELPGGLEDTGELWLALSRWAPALRPHAHRLIAACPLAVGAFLRSGPLPARPPQPDSARPSEDHSPEGFAERLAITLELELPLDVVLRFSRAEALLLERKQGRWVSELERLINTLEEGAAANAAKVWTQRAPAPRLLKRLDLLSRFSPTTTVKPILEAVAQSGSPAQKREALMRAVLNSLELGEYDEGDWQALVRFQGKTQGMSSEAWLRQWDLLWACNLLGSTTSPGEEFERLYAQFTKDSCGPARWRALRAHTNLPGTAPEELLRAALQDSFRPLRIEAIAQLVELEYPIEIAEVLSSLVSLDLNERWVALASTVEVKALPLELLLSVLEQDPPPPAQEHEVEDYPSWLPREHPWEASADIHGYKARQTLVSEVQRRVSKSQAFRAFADLLEGTYSRVVEEIFPIRAAMAPFFTELLTDGSPPQRRFAARALYSLREFELLTAYVQDTDPEVASEAREAIELQQRTQAWRQGYPTITPPESTRTNPWERPEFNRNTLARFTSFEALWNAMTESRLPYELTHSLQDVQEASASVLEWGRERKIPHPGEQPHPPVLKHLLRLYQPHHQPQVLAGLEDTELAPFAVAVLRQNPPIPEVLALIPRGGGLLQKAVDILRGTPHAPQAAKLLREEALADRLPSPYSQLRSHPASEYETRSHRQWLCEQLDRLGGVSELLPWMAPATPEALRGAVIEHLRRRMRQRTLEYPGSTRSLLLSWARQNSGPSSEGEVREIALWLLSVVGEAEDALRWRQAPDNHALSPWSLASVIWLVSRFSTPADLPWVRPFLAHSFEAGTEAVFALARLGREWALEELVHLMEDPPAALQNRGLGWLGFSWQEAAVEVIVRFGDADQAKRAARTLTNDHDVWKVASRYLRLPEHVLFIASHLSSRNPLAEDDDGYDEAKKTLEGMLRKVDARAAHRVMLEAALWGEPFETSFANELKAEPEDRALLLAMLRQQPGHTLALYWLMSLPQAEEHLDRLWREVNAPWWPAAPDEAAVASAR